MELSNDIQNVLKTIKNLKDKYDIHPKDPMSRSIDEPDVEDEIIDVDAVDMSDEETWLCGNSNTSSAGDVKDIYKWLRQDFDDGVHGNEYTLKKIMLEREIGNLDRKMRASIDSRTFTRPKKKFSRPSLDSVVDERKPRLSFSEDDDFVRGRLNFLSKLDKSDGGGRKSARFSLADVENDNETVSQIMGNFRKALNVSQTEDRHVLPSGLRELIREQTLELESSRRRFNDDVNAGLERRPFRNLFEPRRPKTSDDETPFRNPFESVMESSFDSFQNMSPPSLVGSFASINMNSLTESDFITAMNQPQDLYTSFTSTVASDVGDEIVDCGGEFAKNVKEMHETFTKDVRGQETVVLDDRIGYFPKPDEFVRDSGPESLDVTFKIEENVGRISEATFAKPQNLDETFVKIPSLDGSVDSLDVSEGSDHGRKELDRLVRMQEQSLQPIMSTPIPDRTFVRPAWTSTEALDDFDREPKRNVSSTHSSPARKPLDDAETVPKAASTPRLSDQKFTRPKNPDREFIKPEVRPPKAELRPTMIVKPLETQMQRHVPAVSQEPAVQRPRASMLRQPGSRASALPRPAGTGIPRPASRLPGPRALKPTGLPKPSVTKNNWMDGCY